MSLHRAQGICFAVLIGCVALLSRAAPAATASPGYFRIASSTYGAVQNIPTRTITVLRSGGSSGAVSVICKTSNGTATAGIRYTATDVTLTWANGDAAPKTVNVPITVANPFAAHLTFFVTLSDPTGGATLGSPTLSTVTIYGNKGAGEVSIASATYSISQTAGSLTITVNRTGGDAGGSYVRYATANATAVAGADYTATSGGLSWGNDDPAPKSFTIPISNAKAFTGGKTFAVAIAGPIAVTLGTTASAIVTINGDGTTTVTTGEATLSWTKPTEDTNGAALTNLAGYKIFYGTSSSDLSSTLQVATPSALEYEISGLAKGTWYFAVAAYTTAGTQSEPTATVDKTI